MDNTDTMFFAAGGFLNGIAHLLIIAACVVLVIKRKSGPAVLMLVSQILVLLFSVGSIVWSAFSAQQGAEALVNSSKIMAMLGPLPHILFAIGLLWFAVSLAKKENNRE